MTVDFEAAGYPRHCRGDWECEALTVWCVTVDAPAGPPRSSYYCVKHLPADAVDVILKETP